jgi:hypothetical protein
MPHLVWQFPDIKDIYPGSINVSLEKPLRILTYDYTTLPTPCWDADDRNPGRWVSERFGFLEIKFEYPVGGPPHRAWFFDCHNLAYHNDPVRFEIISEKIDNLPRDRCLPLQPLEKFWLNVLHPVSDNLGASFLWVAAPSPSSDIARKNYRAIFHVLPEKHANKHAQRSGASVAKPCSHLSPVVG